MNVEDKLNSEEIKEARVFFASVIADYGDLETEKDLDKFTDEQIMSAVKHEFGSLKDFRNMIS